MTPEQAAAYFKRAADRLPDEFMQAERENVADVFQTAIDHSSGPYSLLELRNMGHPYARRHKRAFLDPGVINVQTGVFIRSWKAEGPTLTGDDLEASIFNTDPKASDFLEPGTDLMIPRPIDQKIAGECAGRIDRRRKKAFERALS